jgi:hypothetical protein
MENKPKKPSKMEALMNKLNVSETYTKPIKYKFPKVKDSVFPKAGYNYMCDLLELPKTSDGFNSLLTVVDIYSNYFDCEPLKSKSAESTLKALKTIFKRGILKLAKASIRSDSGSEFKSVFDKYLHDNNILHLWSLPDRHKQMGNVENLNKQLARVLMTYLSNKGHDYTDWTDLIDSLRTELNDMKSHPPDQDMSTYQMKDVDIKSMPKFKVGDLVYRRLEKPLSSTGQKYHNQKFRAGDVRYEVNEPRKIVRVVAYPSPNPWRYILQDLPNVSYAEAEIVPAKETEEKRIVKKIFDKMTKDKIVYYKVWFKKEKKDQSLWLKKDQLIEDGLQEYIDQYENEKKKK